MFSNKMWCGSYGLRVPRARARNTRIFLARGLWLCVIFAPSSLCKLQTWPLYSPNLVSEHVLCCNDFPYLMDPCVHLTSMQWRIKQFWTQFVGRYCVCYKLTIREGTFLIGAGGGSGYFRNFCEKTRGPPTSQIGLRRDPPQIPKQKHLNPPHQPPPSKNSWVAPSRSWNIIWKPFSE